MKANFLLFLLLLTLSGCSPCKEEKLSATIVQVWTDRACLGIPQVTTTVKTEDGEIGQILGNLGKEGDKIVVYRVTGHSFLNADMNGIHRQSEQ